MEKVNIILAVKMLDGHEVAKHNSRQSCWVIVSKNVYDVTEFLDHHPGGAYAVLRYAGKVSSGTFS